MAAGTGRPLIAARALCKSFGALAVLRDLDLDVGAGEALAVLGPNGAGKSTLLKLLSLVSRPRAGALSLFEVDCFPGRPTAGVLARIGFVGHDPIVYRDLTPLENLAFFARAYGAGHLPSNNGHPAAAVAARDALELVGLAHVAGRPTHALSRGMLQRLALARATLHSPELLLLDEPFSGLDQAGNDLLERLLRNAREAGRTTVLVTHDLDRVARVATRVVVLSGGCVRLDLSPAPPLAELANAYRDATGHRPNDDVGDRS